MNIKFLNKFNFTYNEYTDIEAVIQLNNDQYIELIKLEDESNLFEFSLELDNTPTSTKAILKRHRSYALYLFPKEKFHPVDDLQKLNQSTSLEELIIYTKEMDAYLYISIE